MYRRALAGRTLARASLIGTMKLYGGLTAEALDSAVARSPGLCAATGQKPDKRFVTILKIICKLLIDWLPGRDCSRLRRSSSAADRRRYAAASNLADDGQVPLHGVSELGLFVCREFELKRRASGVGGGFSDLQKLAPRERFELPTNGLTVRRSTTELPGNAEEARIVGKPGP